MQLETSRLNIRNIEVADWKSLQKIWEDFNESKYVIYDAYKNTDEEDIKIRLSRWVDSMEKNSDHLFFAICLKDEMIGFVTMNRRNDSYDLGYGFLQSVQGNGYATESIKAVLEYMRGFGLNKITAGTAIKNKPSVKLLHRLGFNEIGREKVSFYKDELGNDIIFTGGNFEYVF